jgi:hypothetical protein
LQQVHLQVKEDTTAVAVEVVENHELTHQHLEEQVAKVVAAKVFYKVLTLVLLILVVEAVELVALTGDQETDKQEDQVSL